MIRAQFHQYETVPDKITHTEWFMSWFMRQAYDSSKLPNDTLIDPQHIGSELFFVYNIGGHLGAERYITAFDRHTNGINEDKVVCPSDRCTPGKVFPLGQIEEIGRITNSYPPQNSTGPIDWVREVIRRVAAQIPDVVGPPISIIKITPDGRHEWIDPGKCGDSN
jgi:hypothetical protein